MKKVLAPHKEPDGWRYIRVPSCMVTDTEPAFDAPRLMDCALVRDTDDSLAISMYYPDDKDGSRIISSRRVERAVETDDFLRLCAEEGLMATQCARRHLGCTDFWMVGAGAGGYTVHCGKTPEGLVEPFVSGYATTGDTLREAYFRYHAAVGE